MASKSRSEEYSEGFPENIQAFSELEDPRSGKNKRHYFGEFIKTQNNLGKIMSVADISNIGHGRKERRVVLATDCIEWIDKQERESWLGLNSLICVEAHREEISTGKKSVQKRYYLSSREPDAKELQKLIRQHWRIENQCHWILDVVWNEDRSRIRKGNAVENIALLRKMAFNLLKSDTTMKDTVRGKKVRALIDNDTLETFLRIRTPK